MSVTFLTNEDKAVLEQSITQLSEEIVDLGNDIDGKADKPNKPVLIDTITTKEDTSIFTVNTEPDGTPYAFTDLVVRIKAPASSTGNWSLFPFTGENANVHSVTIPSFPNASATHYGMFVCSVKDGFVKMYAYKGPYSTVFEVTRTTKTTAVDDVFRAVHIRAAIIIPAGTIIEIEAVRA